MLDPVTIAVAGIVAKASCVVLAPFVTNAAKKCFSRIGLDASEKLDDLQTNVFPQVEEILEAVNNCPESSLLEQLLARQVILNTGPTPAAFRREDTSAVDCNPQNQVIFCRLSL